MATVEELRKDIEELEMLLQMAERPRVKDFVTLEIRKIQTEIGVKLEMQTHTESPDKNQTSFHPRSNQVYNVKLSTYAWDQSEKFMKIYVDAKGVQFLSKENVTCDFTEKTFNLKITQLNNRNYQLQVSNLLETIVPSESYCKVKTDKVLVMLKKTKIGKTWNHVTEQEQKAKEPKKIDENKDPSEGLMDMLKQMYDDGNDEMKRTIAKAWHDSRSKSPDPLSAF